MKALLKNGVAWLALVMIFIGALPASGQSGQGIWYAGTHPGQTWTALKSDYSGRWNSGLRGQGSIFGEGLITIATLGAGFADDAGTVGRIGNMTRKLDAVLPDEVVPKTTPNRVFWSGGTTAREGAEAFARQTGGQTLEMTRTGRFLDAITTKKTYPYLKPVWDKVSQNFARGADGAVDVFQSSQGVRLQSVWKTVEYPELMKAGNTINFHVTQ